MFYGQRTGLGLALVIFIKTAFIADLAQGVEPNFPEIDDSQSEPVDAKVDISQESPNSNTIHVAHNIPQNSDINIKQVTRGL